jgi:hypothetical protein
MQVRHGDAAPWNGRAWRVGAEFQFELKTRTRSTMPHARSGIVRVLSCGCRACWLMRLWSPKREALKYDAHRVAHQRPRTSVATSGPPHIDHVRKAVWSFRSAQSSVGAPKAVATLHLRDAGNRTEPRESRERDPPPPTSDVRARVVRRNETRENKSVTNRTHEDSVYP